MSPQELADYIRKGDKEENRWENLVSNKFVDDVDEELLKNIPIRHMMLVGLQLNIPIREPF